MIEIPIKYKEVRYPKSFGKSTGGIFTKAKLKIDEQKIHLEHVGFVLFKFIFNQLPLSFEKNKNEPKEIYKNQFGQYKIKYETGLKDCEVTLKVDDCYQDELDEVLNNWKK